MQHHGVRLKAAKCAFLQDSVEYMGHTVDQGGLHTTTQKVEAVKLAPTPKNQQKVRSFLELVHYYGNFIPNLSTLLHPLNELLLIMTRRYTFGYTFVSQGMLLLMASVPSFRTCTPMELRGR